ncbi:hypothetical protein [Rhizobium mongolense]|uniref:Uncharacterized protein n=1 Tax=Rhizobium mongolense TaxID=57676 RepID=A0A7W6WDQ4_9HYPH|nr:hypothetical protein [Rhizobium mongolense]
MFSITAALSGLGSDRIAYGLPSRRSSGFLARLLQLVFAKPAAWRVLDVIIGIVPSLPAISLLVRIFRPA